MRRDFHNPLMTLTGTLTTLEYMPQRYVTCLTSITASAIEYASKRVVSKTVWVPVQYKFLLLVTT